jgi:hypothetical protein
VSDSLALAHANALVFELRSGLDYSGTQRPAIIKTVSDLIAWATELESDHAEAKDTILLQVARLAALESKLATLQASIVAALSSAGPEVGEDERAG